MIKRLLTLGLLLLALPILAACGFTGTVAQIFSQPGSTAERCKAWETPRTYVGCLSDDLKQVVQDFTASSKAGQISKDAFLAAQPYWNEARQALDDAGRLLEMAQIGRDQATAAGADGSSGKRAALDGGAATVEATANARAAIAEDRIRWLKQALARALAPPPPALTTPAPTLLAPTPLAPAS